MSFWDIFKSGNVNRKPADVVAPEMADRAALAAAKRAHEMGQELGMPENQIKAAEAAAVGTIAAQQVIVTPFR